MSERDTALRVLIACRVHGAWSDAALARQMEQDGLDPRAASLCTRLVEGVLQNRALLDYYLDGLLTGRKKLRPALRDILRLGAYQILFLDRVPDAAAVNEAVRQARARFSPREAGLCNGTLRNLARQKDSLTPPADYSIRYSHPAPLVDLMKESVGKRLGTILAADNEPAPISAQWNPLRGEEEQLLRQWEAEGVQYTPHPWLSHCYLLEKTGPVTALESFRKGLFQIQDPAARLSVLLAEPRPGMEVLDLCAAPGGKSLAAAMYMENRGSILSCDLHPGKLPQITAAAERLKVDIITTRAQDGTEFVPECADRFDLVLADVPCSGLGVIRKKPDIRYKDPSDLAALCPVQQALLAQAGKYVKPGGVLLYSTCTILRRENEEAVRAFLESHPEFRPEHLTLPEPLREQETGMITLYQGIDCCDGFFICRMRREV